MDIGTTLREARNKRGLDLTDVEAATKIRVRYLRALENEEWDVLPGGAYTRSFIRTYAIHLGLDGERLADDYRRSGEEVVADRYPRGEPIRTHRREGARGAGGSGARLSPAIVAAGVTILLIGALVILGLTGDDADEPGGADPLPIQPAKKSKTPAKAERAADDGKPSLALEATGEVWVCLLDGRGRTLVDGEILSAGRTEGPFRSDSFAVAFGNGDVLMEINGKRAQIAQASSPAGYRVARDGALSPLPEGQRPDCQ